MLVVEGELEALNRVSWSKEYKRLHVPAAAVQRGFRATLGVGGEPEAIQGPMALFQEAVAELDR
jgi:hypothetical protein